MCYWHTYPDILVSRKGEAGEKNTAPDEERFSGGNTAMILLSFLQGDCLPSGSLER